MVFMALNFSPVSTLHGQLMIVSGSSVGDPSRRKYENHGRIFGNSIMTFATSMVHSSFDPKRTGDARDGFLSLASLMVTPIARRYAL
ncbi:unnamed protein product [Schistocephalus solidus]|uniref:Secreted protein n=1 Tax=Schistocephalus solidus TaxID=70667 RepID=A0A183TTS5_SCHSO|nr:unnamed protein product [Schistocephalus solidus]